MNINERRIVRALIKSCIEHGFYCAIDQNGENNLTEIPKGKDLDYLVNACFSMDEDRLYLYTYSQDTQKYKLRGQFYLVYGNAPWEVICDYSDNHVCNMIYESIESLLNHYEAKSV